MSRNTHVTLLTITASSESWHPQSSCPHDLQESQNLVLHLNSVTKSRPFPIVYSIVFSCTLSLSEPVHIPVFQSCVSCVILCLPFLYTSPCYVPFLASNIPALMLCLLIPYIRLSFMYVFDMFEYRL